MLKKTNVPTYLICALIWGCFISHANGQQIVDLKNGISLEGSSFLIAEFNEKIDGSSPGQSITVIDSGLRRVFTNRGNVDRINEESTSLEEFEIDQPIGARRTGPAGVGDIIFAQKWNEFGRRVIRVRTGTGEVHHLIQGITSITPLYYRVQTVKASHKSLSNWEMRISTKSLSANTLSNLLRRQVRKDSPSDRLRIVTFYKQATRYYEAELELKKLVQDFPELAEERKSELKLLRQAWANQLVRKIRARVDVGQYPFAMKMIDKFPRANVATEISLTVNSIAEEIEKLDDKRKEQISSIEELIKKIKTTAKLEADRETMVDAILEEITKDLNWHNLNRLAAFSAVTGIDSTPDEEKLSVAISGWLAGADGSIDNIEVAFSMFRVRELTIQYMKADLEATRMELLEQLKKEEANAPEYLSKIIANLLPFHDQGKEVADTTGMFEVEIPTEQGQTPVKYWVQLPPDYNPYRRYPVVMTLNGTRTSEIQQIDWWCGDYVPQLQSRGGEASRRGYIVIAPQWKKENEFVYKYGGRNHAAVLSTLRDAMTRYSIDSDKVFLSGHSMGGDAAWDIGLAHPDLWAGVIPIVAKSAKYVSLYWENARKNVPFYFVHGEKDHLRSEKNSMDWNRHLRLYGFDTMVVEYQGRVHEHFLEDIENICDWIDVQKRNFFPQDFECAAMRPWDKDFWWLEIADQPAPSMLLPEVFDLRKKSPCRVKSEVNRVRNSLTLQSGADTVTVWLSQELLDLNTKIRINGRTGNVKPDPKVLIEDARTRRDFQHPFWAFTVVRNNNWRPSSD